MEKLLLGSHVSFTKNEQLVGSVREALDYGCTTFMFYTGAPQNTNRSSIDLELTSLAWKIMEENSIDRSKVIVHAPYIINLANRKNNEEFAVQFLKQEIERTEMLGISYLVLHPGSHVGVGVDEAILNITSALNKVIDSKTNVKICLETMAGKGTEVGKNFLELKRIIEGVSYSDKVMVCLDTCHIHDAGYDVSCFDQVLDEFDSIIGLSKLACIHINDSKNDRGSSKDRHENIGFGKIGFSSLLNILYHPKLKGIPKILETPYIGLEENSKERLFPPYKFEIEMIQNRQFDENVLEKIRNFYK